MADATIPGYDILKNLRSHCIGGCLDDILSLDMVCDKQFDNTYFLVTQFEYEASDRDDAQVTIHYKGTDRWTAVKAFEKLQAEAEDR